MPPTDTEAAAVRRNDRRERVMVVLGVNGVYQSRAGAEAGPARRARRSEVSGGATDTHRQLPVGRSLPRLLRSTAALHSVPLRARLG